MKKSLINSLAAILLLSATAALAQQKMMDGVKDMPNGKTAAGQTVHMAKVEVTRVDTEAGVVTPPMNPSKA